MEGALGGPSLTSEHAVPLSQLACLRRHTHPPTFDLIRRSPSCGAVCYQQLSVPSPPPPSFPHPPSIHLSSCRGGKLRTSEFAVADKGPRQGVLPEWVPQLQLHMLCAGEVDGCVGWGTARGKESWLAVDHDCPNT